mmetsp:Transcript_32334/g.42623  ORF Transcript_32334/g.42623 Transcript_32334/m.42623 type:complete len:515 (+) Transcript_32334:100-1644(+)
MVVNLGQIMKLGLIVIFLGINLPLSKAKSDFVESDNHIIPLAGRIKQNRYQRYDLFKRKRDQILLITGGDTQKNGMAASSVLTTVINLVNNVAGAGLLCLSAGMAAGTGFFPAVTICMILGLMSAHTFSMIGYSSYCTGEMDFKGLCSKTIGKHSAWMTDASIAVMNFAGGIIYAGILGDVFTPLLEAAGFSSNLNRRWSNILLISIFFLGPLSLLEQLSFMKYTSFLGCISVFYTIIFMIVRALDGSYEFGSDFYNTLPQSFRPCFENKSMWNCNLSSLILVANLSLAYIAHFNAPRYYSELKHHTPRRFSIAVYLAFFILVVIHIGAMVAGYKTFGDNSQSNIILNYHPNDILAILARIATGFSILFGYPLEFIGMRDGYLGACRAFLELAEEKKSNVQARVTEEKSLMLSVLRWSVAPENIQKLSIGLLALMTVIAAIIEDIGLTVGVTGALIGAMIVYVIPVLIYYFAKTKYEPGSVTFTTKWALLYVPFGILVALLGTAVIIYEFVAKM